MRTLKELDDAYAAWPTPKSILVGIVRRLPDEGREQPTTAELCPTNGLIGDRWTITSTPGAQVSLIEHRVANALLGGDAMELAGDNLIVDVDLSDAGHPPGTRFRVGEVELEITDEPHHGCKKFIRRYGIDAQRWVNKNPGRRGRYARVLKAGTITLGDAIILQRTL